MTMASSELATLNPALPSIDRWLRELDGQYPGVSLTAMLRQVTWDPVVSANDDHPQQFNFFGRGPGFRAEFFYRWDPAAGEKRPCLAHSSRLLVKIDEKRGVRTEMEFDRHATNLGTVLIRIFAVRSDGSRIPLLGSHPARIETLTNLLISSRLRHYVDSPRALRNDFASIGCHCALAMLGLELSINWENTREVGNLPDDHSILSQIALEHVSRFESVN